MKVFRCMAWLIGAHLGYGWEARAVCSGGRTVEGLVLVESAATFGLMNVFEAHRA